MLSTPLRTLSIALAVVYAFFLLVGLCIGLFDANLLRAILGAWVWHAVIFAAAALGATIGRPPELAIATEYPPSDEGETVRRIVDLLAGRLRHQYAGRRVLRDTHPKSDGLIRARFEIEPNLASEFRVGLFKEPMGYDCWCRFSNAEDEVTHDQIRDFRGLAIKLFGVPGEKLIDDERGTFDFMFIGHNAFFAATPKDFLRFFAASTYFGKWWGMLVYALMQPRGAYNALVGRKQFSNPLDARWFSVAPFQFGPGRAVKYAVKPRNNEGPLPQDPTGADYLRVALTKSLENESRTLDFMVQFQKDPRKQPIESTAIAWKERQTPWIKLATIVMPKQDINAPDRFEFDENLTYNPWHCLPEHRPLGGVNRARRDVMRALQEFRLAENNRQRSDPNTHGPR